jgi:lysophospholipase L1-like esterase
MNTLTSKRWEARHYPQPLGTYRGREPWSPDAPGRSGVSIAVVGDSITAGQGIERETDLYSSILERGLRARGIDAAVYNISSPSWDTDKELAAFDLVSQHGRRFDLVILGYCLNDIATFVTPTPEFLRVRSLLETPPPALAPLTRRSFVASYLYNRYVMLTSPALKQTEGAIVDAYRDPEIFVEHARQLHEFRELTRWYGARLIVLTFPHCVVPWERYPVRDVHRRLDDFWKGLGVPNLDLLASFERHPVRDLQASALDTHPNELAHRLAGERLVEVLAPVFASPPGEGAGGAPAARP